MEGSVKVALWSIVVILALYVASCNYVSYEKGKAFDLVSIGDTEAAVVQRMGMPAVREKPGALFARYASEVCKEACVERLWYENAFSFDTEAWSFELNRSGQVIDKSRWISP